jgi:uncharacterized membrane protein
VEWYLARRPKQDRQDFMEFYDAYFSYIIDQDLVTERQLAKTTGSR